MCHCGQTGQPSAWPLAGINSNNSTSNHNKRKMKSRVLAMCAVGTGLQCLLGRGQPGGESPVCHCGQAGQQFVWTRFGISSSSSSCNRGWSTVCLDKLWY